MSYEALLGMTPRQYHEALAKITGGAPTVVGCLGASFDMFYYMFWGLAGPLAPHTGSDGNLSTAQHDGVCGELAGLRLPNSGVQRVNDTPLPQPHRRKLATILRWRPLRAYMAILQRGHRAKRLPRLQGVVRPTPGEKTPMPAKPLYEYIVSEALTARIKR